MDYDGLGFTAAVALCVKRGDALSAPEIKFLGKIAAAGETKPAETLRLAAIVRRLRQGDLIAEISAGASRHE